MIYLAHYVKRNDSGKKTTEKQGIISAGNPSEALQKVCRILGWPIRWRVEQVEFLEAESIYEQVDQERNHHKIQVAHLDRLMTIKSKG